MLRQTRKSPSDGVLLSDLCEEVYFGRRYILIYRSGLCTEVSQSIIDSEVTHFRNCIKSLSLKRWATESVWTEKKWMFGKG